MKIAVLFGSGPPELNHAVIQKFTALYPALPLCVVSEFAPAAGEWIPFHVQRSLRDNIDSIRAALKGRVIERAAVVLARGTALGKLRAAAVAIAGAKLFAFDEHAGVVQWADFPGFAFELLRTEVGEQFSEKGRGRLWLSRLANPRQAEVPVRARLAQAYGSVATRTRRRKVELPFLQGEPLANGITVVIPSRDGRELLAEMLPHLEPQVGGGEIIVVDNGSSDETRAWLAEAHPHVRVIESQLPLSFARAINQGIRAARYSHLVMLNNDMIVAPGFLDALSRCFVEVPSLFCATAQIFFPEGIRREETGKAVWRRDEPLDFPVRCDVPLQGEDRTWVLYGSGGCSMFDTAMLREPGGVSEAYDPAYVEDLDFGYRAWKRGWPTVYCSGAQVEHRHRATTSRFFTPRELDLFTERNYLRFLVEAIGDRDLFRELWRDAVRRLQLRGDVEALRHVPALGLEPPQASGPLTEREILALGNGDAAAFPGGQSVDGPVVIVASPYLPYPLSHGGAVRIFNLLRETAKEFRIVLIAFCAELETPARELLDLCTEIIMIRCKGSHYRKDTTRPDVVEEFESLTFRAYLKQSCVRWKPALVQLEFTWLAHYADACGSAKTILVEHDITFDLQRQLLHADPSWEREQQLAKWEKFEKAAWKRVDRVITMSPQDARGIENAVVIPNGVDCVRFTPAHATPDSRRVLFIGSFAHLPNVMAVDFFLKEVWPKLPGNYSLHIIAGRNHEKFHAAIDDPRIEVEGFVSDVRQAYERSAVVIAPLVASAGTNIKILEAMAMGKAIVSTSSGVNGIDIHPGIDVIVTNDASEFAGEIEKLAENPVRAAQLGAAAREFSMQFDWTAIGWRLRALYRDLV